MGKALEIPEALAGETIRRCRDALRKMGRQDLASSLIIEAKRGFIYVKEGHGGPVCRLRYTGDPDDWDLQMFKWSTERYDTGGEFAFLFGGGPPEECIESAVGGYHL